MEPTQIVAWGGDHSGQMGLAHEEYDQQYCKPQSFSFNVWITAISCGDKHTAFITNECEVFTIGSNAEGRLGIGDRSISNVASPVQIDFKAKAIQISCGAEHTALIDDMGSVYTWGNGKFGALGLGTTENEWTPAKVPIRSSARANDVSCGSRHTMFIVTDGNSGGKLYAIGEGEAGQLGTGRRMTENLPVHIPTDQTPVQVAAGVSHTTFVTTEGHVYSMGGNTFGQLGLNSTNSADTPEHVATISSYFIDKVACGQHTAAKSSKGDLFIWGSGTFGKFFKPKLMNINVKFQDMDIGGSFGCGIDMKGKVWSWGSNTSGELGVGDFNQRQVPVRVVGLDDFTIGKLACGGSYTMALRGQTEVSPKSYQRSESVFDTLESVMEELQTTKKSSPKRIKSRSVTPSCGTQDKLDSIRLQSSAQKSKQKDLEAEVRSTRNLAEVHIVELEERTKISVQRSQSRIQELENELSMQKQKVNDLSIEVHTSRQEAMEREADCQTLRSQLDEKASILQSEREIRFQLEATRYQDQQDVENLRGNFIFLEAQVGEQKAINRQLQEDLNISEQHRHRLEEAIKALQDEALKSKEEVKRLSNTISEQGTALQLAQSDLVTARKNYDTEIQKTTQLESQNLCLGNVIADMQGQLGEQLDRNGELYAQNEYLESKRSHVEIDNSASFYHSRYQSFDTTFDKNVLNEFISTTQEEGTLNYDTQPLSTDALQTASLDLSGTHPIKDRVYGTSPIADRVSSTSPLRERTSISNIPDRVSGTSPMAPRVSKYSPLRTRSGIEKSDQVSSTSPALIRSTTVPAVDQVSTTGPAVDRVSSISPQLERSSVGATVDRVSSTSPLYDRYSTSPIVDRVSSISPLLDRGPVDRVSSTSPLCERSSTVGSAERVSRVDPIAERARKFKAQAQRALRVSTDENAVPAIQVRSPDQDFDRKYEEKRKSMDL